MKNRSLSTNSLGLRLGWGKHSDTSHEGEKSKRQELKRGPSPGETKSREKLREAIPLPGIDLNNPFRGRHFHSHCSRTASSMPRHRNILEA